MEPVAALVGTALLCIVMWDILMSALGTGSAGPLAPRVARAVFAGLKALPDAGPVHRLCGPLVTASIGAAWIVLMCLGWTLVFASSQLAGVTGMIVLTLSVSFVYSTTQAVATGRAVIALAEIHGPGTDRFDTVLLPQIATLVGQIKAIPFSLYFSTRRKQRRLPAALLRLHRDPRLDREAQARLEVLLAELPGLESLRPGQFDQRFTDWVATYTIGKDDPAPPRD